MVSSDSEYDESVHLSAGNVAVDDPTHPSMLQIRIKRSKSDRFGRGIHLYVGKRAQLSTLWQ